MMRPSETGSKAAQASVGANGKEPAAETGRSQGRRRGASACKDLKTWDRRPVNHRMPCVLPISVI